MNPKDLAIMLNVSQGQIVRIQREGARRHAAPYLLVPTDMLETWRREMRTAEMYLREWFHTPEHAPENCRDCGAPFNNADAPSGGRCMACRAR